MISHYNHHTNSVKKKYEAEIESTRKYYEKVIAELREKINTLLAGEVFDI